MTKNRKLRELEATELTYYYSQAELARMGNMSRSAVSQKLVGTNPMVRVCNYKRCNKVLPRANMRYCCDSHRFMAYQMRTGRMKNG